MREQMSSSRYHNANIGACPKAVSNNISLNELEVSKIMHGTYFTGKRRIRLNKKWPWDISLLTSNLEGMAKMPPGAN